MKLFKAPLVSTILAAASYECVQAAHCYLAAIMLIFLLFHTSGPEPSSRLGTEVR